MLYRERYEDWYYHCNSNNECATRSHYWEIYASIWGKRPSKLPEYDIRCKCLERSNDDNIHDSMGNRINHIHRMRNHNRV